MTDDSSRRRLLQFRLDAALQRDTDGAPLLPPLFVLQQGPDVQVVDLRPAEDAAGALGYIPGSVFVSVERLEQLVAEGPVDRPVVLVSRTGHDAAEAALRLQRRGMRSVAAMAGGLASWRRMGFGTSRDPTGVTDRWATGPEMGHAEGTSSLEQVRAHIGDTRNIRWVKLASLATYKSFSCIDGRDERGLIGTPGGDAGEFLVSLAAVERVTGATLDEQTVEQALLAHLDAFGDFSRHCDSTAFEKLIVALRGDARLGTAIEAGGAVTPDDLRRLPAEVHPAVLEHLLNPDHLGCGHIRLMLQKQDEYGIRAELVEAFLRAFTRLWWAGAPELDLTVLQGEHEETAVLNIRLDEKPWSLSRVPLVSPTCAGNQVFVNHPDIADYLRRGIVEYHRRGLGPVTVDDGAALQEAIDELAGQQLSRTVGYLARGLPIYDVVFSRNGSYTLREAGS
jgi:rhodanese-related sulfurtransferase